jgi:hypothetical protein
LQLLGGMLWESPWTCSDALFVTATMIEGLYYCHYGESWRCVLQRWGLCCLFVSMQLRTAYGTGELFSGSEIPLHDGITVPEIGTKEVRRLDVR